ncbi:TPA: conjugal transfer protein TraB [Pseudomonas aeruginosa]|nr:conjugal transfer protein TraB [Pseudomonas aeruginosa]MCV4061397.1 conjugal transfer protein TraB [Pseudomonas aeruginosa]MCV4079373.1 conjugal transfer protein TraB [Pseudomonas aeruginosa]MCV4148811.1 conjugal transfer protein TraB [Pseudomonas aeruginosa]MCV4180386.1 conjugal transfer protein TraB [Pseudomonas aeruginosa]MCV4219849.1 conjugal transfer protein TraB [Pseudomonas aeruginosa]
MSEAENKQNPLMEKKTLLVGGIIAACLGVAFLGGGEKKVESVDVAAKPIEVGSDQINAISVKDKDAALTVFAKQFEAVEQKLTIQQREADENIAGLRKEMKDSNNEVKSMVSSLANEVLALRANGVETVYQEANKNDSKTPPSMPDKLPDLGLEGGLNFDGLNFDMSAPKPQVEQPAQGAGIYGPNYFILKPQNAGTTVTSKNGGDSLSASESDLFASMSSPAPQAPNYATQNAGQAQAEPQQEYASAAEAYEAQQKDAESASGSVPTGPRMERITIPAFSYVEVTTLHGVACPIGANSPNSKSQSEIPARPVVLPVRGIYRGPNGSSVDVGNVHLMGLCAGRRTSSSSAGRATIRVEQMSYWDEGGDAQMSASTGYIVDTRDNEQDVYGRLDKASGRTLALESAAAAGAAFASTLSQQEYTTQNNLNPEGGSSTVQQLTGDATKAATTQGIAAIFAKISQRFEQEANAAIDTVVVEPGIRLRFVTDQPIHIYKPAEAFDLDGSSNDVLL